MKQVFLCLFLFGFFSVMPLSAGKINLPEAEKAGLVHLEDQQNTWFFQIKQGLLHGQFSGFYIKDSFPVADEKTGEVLFYVLQLAPEGFIVAAPDTDIQPVITYSYYGSFPMMATAENILLKMLKSDMRLRLAAIPVTADSLKSANNDKWKNLLTTGKTIEQWPPVEHSQYNKGWLKTDCQTTAPNISRIIDYWKHCNSGDFSSTGPEDGCTVPDNDGADDGNVLTEKYGFASARSENQNSTATFFPKLIKNMRNGWPVHLSIQGELDNSSYQLIVDGYRKTSRNDDYFHLNFGCGNGAWYALPLEIAAGYNIVKDALLDIHPTLNQYEPNNTRPEAYPIMASDFTGPNLKWETGPNTSLRFANGRDWYRFEAEAGDKLTIIYTAGPNGPTDGDILLFKDNTLIQTENSSGSAGNKKLTYVVKSAGTYFVAVGHDTIVSIDEPIPTIRGNVIPGSEGDYKLFITKYVDDGDPEYPVLMGISVTGPSKFMENKSANYTATAEFSDGTDKVITDIAIWTENSTVTYMDSGIKGKMHATAVTSNQTVTISARYSFGGITKTDTMSVTIVDFRLSSITVSGPASIYEGDSAAYTATANYTDGSTKVNVTASASWSLDPGCVGCTINPSFATLSGNTLTGKPVLFGQVIVRVRAAYSGISGYKDVAIKDSRQLSSIAIIGPVFVFQNSFTFYKAVAYFTDGTSYNITNYASWTAWGNGVITSNGVLNTFSISLPSDKFITIWALFTYNGINKGTSISVSVME